MNRVKVVLLAGAASVALLASACSGDGGAPAPVGQGTAAANSAVPTNEPLPSEIGTEAPEGGAAVRLGDIEEAITKVGCTSMNDDWTMSGSNEGGAKVALITSADRQTVVSASVVLADGKLVDYKGETGRADIAWDGESFTVTGQGTFMDLAAAEQDPEALETFVIKGACPTS
ncbi:lipoprotein LpqH [Tessaracoccus flavus]|jgi:hypothetical protein|uniref:Uncharacterized protein n=1 Tax=Tessaracoccus flavus TaxID=1610493 RepID=A0A1Q2CGQ4_9ACTN|nr:lipoprotein LpqH [Tessaracoccus flavus]AQP45283.1 hypothetical protein RPIT_11155 [Tessaracoccus flavus]SDY50206.1 lipoprotein antigen [Tessaracoccus flavus]